jgi:hypothetical protein
MAMAQREKTGGRRQEGEDRREKTGGRRQEGALNAIARKACK